MSVTLPWLDPVSYKHLNQPSHISITKLIDTCSYTKKNKNEKQTERNTADRRVYAFLLLVENEKNKV